MRRWSSKLMMAAIAASFVLAMGAGTVAGQAPFLYGGTGGPDDASDLLIIDPATVGTDEVGDTGYGLTGLAINPIDGALYGATTNNGVEQYRALVRIDRATGAATEIAEFDEGDFPVDLTFTGDGTLYGWFEEDDRLGVIDTATGGVTFFGVDYDTYGGGLAHDPVTGRTFLAGGGESGQLSLVNLATGEIEDVVELDGETSNPISALTFSCDGTLYAVVLQNFDARPAWLATIDPDTGSVTILGESASRLDAIAAEPCAAPVPPPTPPAPDDVAAEPTQVTPRFTG